MEWNDKVIHLLERGKEPKLPNSIKIQGQKYYLINRRYNKLIH